jgi:hypothetical protein
MNRDEKPLDFGVLFLEQTHGFHGFWRLVVAS